MYAPDLRRGPTTTTFLGTATYITEPQEQNKATTILKIEEAQPPNTFDELYTPLPNQVEFKKINTNVLNSMKFPSKSNDKEDGLLEVKSMFTQWQKYLNLEEHKAVVSDSFWYVVTKFFKREIQPDETSETYPKINFNKLPKEDQKLLTRISRNYINLFLTIDRKDDRQLFFKTYFDILAQSVFYALFYSFPLSRSKFNDDLKKQLLDEFSYLFTGIEIANSQKYLKEWNLDLGAGNIFKKQAEQKFAKQQQYEQSLPPIVLSQTTVKARNKRVMVPIKFSPIVQIYLAENKYSTRNQIQEYKMKFTESEKNQDELELKFARYIKLADQLKSEAIAMRDDNENRKKKMKSEIKTIKQETVNHHKRLEKRKAEELERGAHEYANYLVSMLNAGITVANLGVSKQK
ncbi:unnamed protein product (macronuclear) [Paramecium tetraurelia]|uniref:Uncharacterized protein n=2 Tax=Paramecium TaxID=5884 RepID=A0E418_PARTE|nr:uncharacterized protein GSPATT00023208001 [Paramecium tetraurelia]CAD8169176.1 unnamed protein product [Paramecium octaurelia]CAD8190268.1 unnamed protein product [Paramecium octaurelia]CAK90035.1 unnamed protein product [Paramecium tetraurelia]|eukprot:XP_001457432.1 hypothetical protein (macronuclear) [Paramecium tetraurelia strain d4-2]